MTMGRSRVYILADYGEDGDEDVVFTLDKSHVVAMFERCHAPLYDDRFDLSGAREALRKALERDEVGVYALFDGWGGTRLRIVDEWVPT